MLRKRMFRNVLSVLFYIEPYRLCVTLLPNMRSGAADYACRTRVRLVNMRDSPSEYARGARERAVRADAGNDGLYRLCVGSRSV